VAAVGDGLVDQHAVPARGDRVRVAVDMADGDPAGPVAAFLAVSFGCGGLGQQRHCELPCLGHRQPGPRGAVAVPALPEIKEHPSGGVGGAAEREPPDGQVAPA
jgi:hypothetical protein